MKLTLLIYSATCFYSCIPFFKQIKNNKFLNLKTQKALHFLFILFYIILWFGLADSSYLLLFSSLVPIGFLILIPYLKQKTRQELFSLLCSLIVPIKAQMKLGICFMEAWDKAVQDLEDTPNKLFISEISEILRFQKDFWHPSPQLRLFINHLTEIRKSSQSLDRLSELQNKLKTEEDFKRKSSRALLQLRWQSFILTAIYFCVFCLSFSAYRFSYPKLMGFSLCLFMLGLYWLSKIGREIKWSL